jgi:hypothetical protein
MDTPKPIPGTPNLNKLQKLVEDYVNFKGCDHCDCDCRHFIFETAIETFYGYDIWKYINSKLC